MHETRLLDIIQRADFSSVEDVNKFINQPEKHVLYNNVPDKNTYLVDNCCLEGDV